MDEVVALVLRGRDGIEVIEADGDTYFIYNPQRTLPDNQRQSFVTLIASDAHDSYSRLGDGRYRLNIGVGKARYEALLGPRPERDADPLTWGHDFTRSAVLMPHPVYGRMYWISVVNPVAAMAGQLDELIGTAYAEARGRVERRAH